MTTTSGNFTLFADYQLLASGTLAHIALDVKRATEGGAYQQVLLFDDATGRVIDIATHGTDAEVQARYAAVPAATEPAVAATGAGAAMQGDSSDSPESTRARGRPKLGVVAREVTLLPRHWEWLQSQSGGASVVLRRLVDEARRTSEGRDQERQARDRAYHFMSAIGGDLPGFESATRALYAGDRAALVACLQEWPPQVREHALRFAGHGGDLR